MTIPLPKYVFEDNLYSFLSLLCTGNSASDVTLDFKAIKHYIPAAITSIITCIRTWQENGIPVVLINHQNNEAFRYLQRIDFFSTLGLNYQEDFARHAPMGDFVTITEINNQPERDLTKLIDELVGTLFPEEQNEELYKLLQYALGEIIRNSIQHSCGLAYVSAQYNKAKDLIRIGVSDNGIGIRNSFKDNNSPHFKEEFSDQDCLYLALQSEVSSKNHIRGPYGDPVNAGVGLSIVHAIAAETLGYFYLASGDATYIRSGNNEGHYYPKMADHQYKGTVVSVAFSRIEVYKYIEVMMSAKRAIGLIKEQDTSEVEGIFK